MTRTCIASNRRRRRIALIERECRRSPELVPQVTSLCCGESLRTVSGAVLMSVLRWIDGKGER